MTLIWKLLVDWDNNGSLETDEASRIVGISKISRGKKTLYGSSGFTRPQPGSAVIDLENYDGRYDALNTSSPIYPNVVPGRSAQLLVDYVGLGDNTSVIRGQISKIFPVEKNGQKITRVVIEDGWRWVSSSQAAVATTADMTTNEAIKAVLDSVSWSGTWSTDYISGEDVIPYFWSYNKSGLTAICELAESEMGQISVTKEGNFSYKSRQSLYFSESSVTITQDQIGKDVYLPQPWDSIRDTVRIKYYIRKLQTQAVLWTLQDIPAIAPSDTFNVIANFSDAAYNLVDPVINTDLTFNTQSDGGGVDVSATISTDVDNYGDAAKIDVQNNPFGVYGYLTLLQIRGQAVETINTAEVQSYQPVGYSQNILELDMPWIQNTNVAVGLASWLCSRINSPRAFPVISIEDRPEIQFAYDLYAHITLQVPKLGIEGDYFIMGIEHYGLSENVQGTRTFWYLEPATTVTRAWKFPTKIGTESYFVY